MANRRSGYSRRKFSEDERDFIRDNIGKYSYAQLGIRFRRKREVIYRLAKSLGLSKRIYTS